MGYERSTLKLVFDREEYEGLEIKSKRLSVGALLSLSDLVATDWRANRAAGVEAFNDMAKELAKVLTWWNLEEDGVAVPLTGDAIAGLDFGFVLTIANALLSGTAGVSRPLSPPSSDSDTSVEESIPMETLSESPPS